MFITNDGLVTFSTFTGVVSFLIRDSKLKKSGTLRVHCSKETFQNIFVPSMLFKRKHFRALSMNTSCIE